jgi:hypothetical protein
MRVEGYHNLLSWEVVKSVSKVVSCVRLAAKLAKYTIIMKVRL